MRNLDRDRKRVFVARLGGMEMGYDEDGLPTGETVQTYSEPEPFYPTISMTRGNAVDDMFGNMLEYDRTLTVDDPDFEVSESDILWIDAQPSGDPDYSIKAVRRSGSYTVIAVKKVA